MTQSVCRMPGVGYMLLFVFGGGLSTVLAAEQHSSGTPSSLMRRTSPHLSVEVTAEGFVKEGVGDTAHLSSAKEAAKRQDAYREAYESLHKGYVLPESYLDLENNEAHDASELTQNTRLSNVFGHLEGVAEGFTDEPQILSGPTSVRLNRGNAPGKVWSIKLGSSQFKVSIEDIVTGFDINKALDKIKRVATWYRKGFEIVSETGKDGVAIYNSIGACAHGGQLYLNIVPQCFSVGVLSHEIGHIVEQRARSQESDILDRWAQAITADAVSVSGYGDSNPWEDFAEFAKYYAFCLDGGQQYLDDLKTRSPKRYALAEHILELAGAKPKEWECSTSYNFVVHTHYSQRSLTSYCPCCDCNPIYGPPNSVEKAVGWCKEECKRRGATCTGFFFQTHPNGHEICGFFTGVKPLQSPHKVNHWWHKAGQICDRNAPSLLLQLTGGPDPNKPDAGTDPLMPNDGQNESTPDNSSNSSYIQVHVIDAE